MPQEPPLDPELTVFEAVVAGMGETSRLLAEYHEVSHRLAEADRRPRRPARPHGNLQHELETLGAWSHEALAEQVISRFDLDPERPVGTLSGGQKKRLALARALAVAPEVLLLDEPTNHLDIAAIEWLEQFLLDSGVTLLFVTHDRRFLDRLATRIVELDRGRLASFPGSFAAYQTAQGGAARRRGAGQRPLRQAAHAGRSLDPQGRRGAAHPRRVPRAAARPAARRARRPPRAAGQVSLELDAGDKSGKLVAELKNVGKRFGDKTVVRDFSCRILRGDKIGVIGPNGAGKTTLLRLILGELRARQRHGAPGHQAGGRLLRPVPRPARSRGDAGRQ